MKTLKVFLMIAVVAVVLAVAGCSGGADEPVPPPEVAAPDFQLENLDGEVVALSEFRGRPVMLNFWATWCGPCRTEMPHFQSIYEDPGWRASGLEILAVNVGESAEQARGFMEENGFTFPVLLDGSRTVASAYNIRAIPTSFFIDESGIIKAVKAGTFVSRADLEKTLTETILAED